MNNNEIFQQFWRDYKWPEALADPEYRLYYDDQGEVIAYTTENLAGKYLRVTLQQFALADRKVRVKDGKLVPRVTAAAHKLIPGDAGTACHPRDVAVVVNPGQQHQKWHRR